VFLPSSRYFAFFQHLRLPTFSDFVMTVLSLVQYFIFNGSPMFGPLNLVPLPLCFFDRFVKYSQPLAFALSFFLLQGFFLLRFYSFPSFPSRVRASNSNDPGSPSSPACRFFTPRRPLPNPLRTVRPFSTRASFSFLTPFPLAFFLPVVAGLCASPDLWRPFFGE